ncbi:MAG: CHAD domain-containing protein [Bacteroidales bacterium]|nr:CHAD domain-containing protein [Bacteroidales bacterium]
MPQTPLISEADSVSLSISAGKHLRVELQSLIAASEMLIPAGQFPTPDAVHDIRVNMKRGRAILKLLRASPDARYYNRENSALRDISALFSQSREADVLRKTIRYMAKKEPGVFNEQIIDWFRGIAGLESVGNAPDADKTDKTDKTDNADKVFRDNKASRAYIAADASERLARAWYRVGFLNLRSVNRELLLDGLLNSFLRAEENYHRAKESEHPAHIHELRKRIKDLLYQVRFFSDYNPDHFGKIYRELDNLGSILGKCNDLAVAINIASGAGAGAETETEARTKFPAIGKAIQSMEMERVSLFRKVLPDVQKLFASFYSGA